MKANRCPGNRALFLSLCALLISGGIKAVAAIEEPVQPIEAWRTALVRDKQSGRYADAEASARKLLSVAESTMGANSPQALAAANNLADLVRLQGRYADADKLWQGAQQGFEKILGVEHPYVATVLNNRGVLAIQQGQYETAEALLRQSMKIYEKAADGQNPHLVGVLTNLAAALRLQGRIKEAEAMQRRAMSVQRELAQKNIQGADASAPTAAVALQPLVSLVDIASRRTLAKKTVEQSAGQSQDPYLSGNLGTILLDAGQIEEAEPLLKESLKRFESEFGPQALETSTAELNLAELYRKKGELNKAEPLIRRALVSKERAVGKSHPDLAVAMNNLAAVRQEQGDLNEADVYYAQSLKLSKALLGPSHPLLAEALANRAAWYSEQRLPGEASSYYQEAFTVLNGNNQVPVPLSDHLAGQLTTLENRSSGSLSPEHRRYFKVLNMAAESMNHRGTIYARLGDAVMAENLFKGAIAIYEKSFGAQYPDIAFVLVNYADLLERVGRKSEAAALEARVRSLREKKEKP